jgi:3-deoxy-D-manno-octulosonic acid kinase
MQGIAQGRGAVWFVAEPDGRDTAGWVLRHYRRGGLARHFSADRFLWLGEARVRAFAELRLLAELERLALPAPRPVAARYTRAGTGYRADLLATRIAATRSFASALAGRPAAPVYSAIGACIRRFHDAGICHADLNAHNVLIDAAGRIHLIDFDRGSVRAPGEWRAANLARLRRSLRKISAGAAPALDDWSALLAGYAGG